MSQSRPEPSTHPWRPAPPASVAAARNAVPGEAPVDTIAATEDWSRVEQALGAGQFSLRSERRGTEHVVAVFGELDLVNAGAVEAELEAVERTAAEQITLDLSGLEFIDSTGLHLIIRAAARSTAERNRLRLRRGSARVQRIFEITGTTHRLPFAD